MSSNQDPMYTMVNSQNGIFANVIHTNNYDFIPELDPSKQQQLNTAKSNGYDPAYRPFSYTTNPMRQRHQLTSSLPHQYRDNYYHSATEMYTVTPSPQSPASNTFDPHYKQYHESFGHSSSTPHPLAGINGKTSVAQHSGAKGFNPQASFAGVQLTSQTPFGPHVPINAPPHLGNGTVPQNPSAPATTTGTSAAIGQEEISTIFVVGFPDDMQEREFQNMFTFSQGFEAATLKIPNKDNTNYAGNSGRQYGVSNDPFNLVPANQGGGIDGGRDGNWAGDDSSAVAQFGNNGVAPPRKQIIGFAKFRTRHDALLAKDLLQGKRIDMEKGAVLKAEMAKKNLHTKRGVGTIPTSTGVPSVSTGGMTGIGSNIGVYQQSSVGFGHKPDPYAFNVAESLGVSTGLGMNRFHQAMVHESSLNVLRDEDEARRRESTVTSIGYGSIPTRGARIEEEDRERRRDKEFRLRNPPAFDPFSSFPSQSYPDILRQSVNPTNNVPRAGESYVSQQDEETVGPWDNVRTAIAQHTPPRSASPTLSAPQLPTSTLDAALTVERRASSGPISPGGNGGSQSDGFPDSSSVEVEMAQSLNGLTLSTSGGDTSPQLPSPASNASSGVGKSIDQNPPINTLYVGNLPSGVEHLEEKLRELFSAQPGFRRLCFRQKGNGPMCFVEFEDVNFASKALNNLHGQTLNGLVKGTGIRLSYSKNPLGVRTPTSAGGLLQQQQLQHAVDLLQSRPSDDPLPPKSGIVRREAKPLASPNPNNGSSFGNSFLASPPPRFFSSSPSTLTSFTSAASSQPISGSVFPRNSTSNILNLYNPPSNFSPFGFPNTSAPMIPEHHIAPPDEQNSANTHTVQQHFHRVMSPPAVNLEAARAG